MRSIAQGETPRKGAIRIIKGGLGFMVKGQSCKGGTKPPPQREAGDITTFSRHSQRRLRETLAMAKPRNTSSKVFGFTFTIPGDELPPDKVRQIWHMFQTEVTRSYRDVGMVWRIELQTRVDRRQAHWHAVVWIPEKNGIPAIARGVMLAATYRKIVLARVGALTERTLRGFDRFGVDIKPLDGSTPSGIITYLCDHATKHKQAQLGWKGRQWGVVNRKSLTFEGDTVLEVDERTHKRAARQFRRLKDHLKKQGRYSGVRVNPAGNVSKALFGKDTERLIRCYENERRNTSSEPPPPDVDVF